MPTKVDYFLDTNILIYAALGRGLHERKRKIAHDLVVDGKFGISTQVLQEFYTSAIRKTARPLTPDEALEWLNELQRQECVTVDKALIRVGIEISQRYRINYWDGAILAAAERLEAEVVYTDDLNHGQSYGSIRVTNPFL
ncbi:MAG: PIN domain-containing protein [Methyloceanibacter sp.]